MKVNRVQKRLDPVDFHCMDKTVQNKTLLLSFTEACWLSLLFYWLICVPVSFDFEFALIKLTIPCNFEPCLDLQR